MRVGMSFTLLCALMSTASSRGGESADWKPPKNPNPSEILDQAHKDARALRYKEALAKHLWYHAHAIELEPAQSGVRRSFALGYWHDLGLVYPPAMEQLKAARDAAAVSARRGDATVESFGDAAAINRYLDEEAKTVDLFMDVEKQDKENAKRVFHTAEPSLIKAKKYAVCDKYLDPKANFSRMAAGYRVTLDFEKKRQAEGKRVPGFARNNFTNEAATLVALLTVNKRRPEAEEIAAEARKVIDDRDFAVQLDDALKGKVPDPWP